MSMLDGPRVPPLAAPATHLVVLCHGYGSDGNDLIGLAPHWQKSLPGAAFVSPNAAERLPGETNLQGCNARCLTKTRRRAGHTQRPNRPADRQRHSQLASRTRTPPSHRAGVDRDDLIDTEQTASTPVTGK